MRSSWCTVAAFLYAHCLATAAAGSRSDADSRVSNDTLFWGPYRPNLYFGVRPRLPKSLSTGLMWARVEDYHSPQQNFRHTCEQNEGMAGYGWDEYDIRTGGRQTIHDSGNQVDLVTEFVKIPGTAKGGSWGARITGKLREDARPDLKTTVVFYAALEGAGMVEVDAEGYEDLGYAGDVTLRGQSEGLGSFRLDITKGNGNRYPEHNHPTYAERPLDRTMVTSVQAPEMALWQAKPFLFQVLKQSFDEYSKLYGEDQTLPPYQAYTFPTTEPRPGNIHFVQKVFEGPFQFDIIFNAEAETRTITSDDISRELKAASKSFSEKFKEVFTAAAPFDKPQYDAFSKSMFSNLLGGVGYFYGDAVVDKSYASEYDEENEGFWEDTAEARARTKPQLDGPHELFTAIPSRPFFPRGFLWDEGFHLLLLIEWDTGLTIDIVRSWFNLMDEDGWIAREQILGAEARSKVPQEFQTQYPHYANPPTLFLILELIANRISASSLNPAETSAYTTALRELYPLMKRHYFWYRKTQRGDITSYDRTARSSKEGYRWRGRTPAHILTSGLDDYPRAQPPHPGELHVDLLSWMGLMSKSLHTIATILGESDDAKTFASHASAITDNIDDLHWEEGAKTFCDASIDQYEEHIHVCHKGYISIFPFLTGMLAPSHPHLGAILDTIADPEELWSPHGIRSLSKSDPFYGTGENYWRSPIWVQMNYLVLTNLLKIAEAKGPHQKRASSMYTKLRRNLVNTVYKSWKETGFAWEQYNPETGMGQRTQHFTGWTSLVVNVMCMPDVPTSSTIDHGEL